MNTTVGWPGIREAVVFNGNDRHNATQKSGGVVVAGAETLLAHMSHVM